MAGEQMFGAQAVGAPIQFGPYQLQELINTGGMSELWLATDAQGQVFALRRMIEKPGLNLLTKQRFFHGCDVLSKIHSHEYVITYYAHGKIEGVPYLLMEYVEGANLKELFALNDPILQENIGNILIDMAVGLEHVHDSGFMHLDFKPENVMISRNANVRLIDFDLSQPIPDKPKKASKNPGTPAYMAPEQLLRQPFDQRVDIFAYGVSAYELLTGQKPFGGESAEMILKNELDRSNFQPPRALNPDIPPKLEQIILKCIVADMDKRYPTMTILTHELKSALYV
ncbi:MAG TPA: serine/threonine-protein kinase [Methylomirabilota bacterium]|nr:serine/threonine-protein kinase [Methylomirabilota bacterium]